MKFKPLLIVMVMLVPVITDAQSGKKPLKYPSLFWEIRSQGSSRPSYLFGTMHVSSKLVYNLPDSFYTALKSIDVVALENDMGRWQKDMDEFDFDYTGGMYGDFRNRNKEYFTSSMLQEEKYDALIQQALTSNPSVLNSLLYRTLGNRMSDFEEDTFLDMFIYQCGKKYGKKTAGLENFAESIRLMFEGLMDAAKDKNKKERSYLNYNRDFSPEKMEEAYRTGNLDLLDSIERYNSMSDLFDEKFLYRRNEIQADGIDSIMKTGSTVFAGVGAAHLPGTRGVIELLRKKGYIVRPIMMNGRSSKEKEAVDNIIVAVEMKRISAADSLYTVEAPGEFYSTSSRFFNQVQHADMSNGSYYLITRVPTNAGLWAQNEARTMKIIDSLLYENIPGKIITNQKINRNGYSGYDIVNRTRRGDVQRYHIFVTASEVVLFKMSGIGNYVSNSKEAAQFFNSIQLRSNAEVKLAGRLYTPEHGGFAAAFPHEPYKRISSDAVYEAQDAANYYRIYVTHIHNDDVITDDTFDLSLMEESFLQAEMVEKQLERKQIKFKGYPALDAKFTDKQGNIIKTRFIIQGAHQYALFVVGKKENAGMNAFLNSFEIRPFQYGSSSFQKDTLLHYSVTTPFYPKQDKKQIDFSLFMRLVQQEEGEDVKEDFLYEGASETRTITNDTTGERISIHFYKMPFYEYVKDSARYFKETPGKNFKRIIRKKTTAALPDRSIVKEWIVGDSASSRVVWIKSIFKDGIVYNLKTIGDTLTAPSSFTKEFYSTFRPDTALKGFNIFEKKSNYFFADLKSKDSAVHKRAKKYIQNIELDSTDFQPLSEAIATLNWNEKNYLNTKCDLISRFGSIKTQAASRYLHDLYFASGDTVQLQYAVLETLLSQQTSHSYALFSDIVKAEPPVIDNQPVYTYNPPGSYVTVENDYEQYDFRNNSFIDELSDSLELTKTILPSLIPLINLEDYKEKMMDLLADMVRDSIVQAGDYEIYFDKFFLEAKHLWRKQLIADKKKSIQRAEAEKNRDEDEGENRFNNRQDRTNNDLLLYARLLIPFTQRNKQVQPFLNQLLQTDNKQLKYDVMLLLLDHRLKIPDTLYSYFAALKEYRYRLFSDLKERKQDQLFPIKYRNHQQLALSKLYNENMYIKPDSIVFIKRLPAKVKNKKGFVYFYKYRLKEDEETWKIATVGLVPEKETEIEFYGDTKEKEMLRYIPRYMRYAVSDKNDMTGFSDETIDPEKTIDEQIQKLLKRKLIAQRPSGERFYEKGIADLYNEIIAPHIEE